MSTLLCVGENGARLGFTEPLQDNMLERIRDGKVRVLDQVDDGPGIPPTAGEVSGAFVGVSALPATVPDTPVIVRPPEVRPETLTPPRGNASTEDWIAYAVSQGMSKDEALGLRRDEIKARLVLDPED